MLPPVSKVGNIVWIAHGRKIYVSQPTQKSRMQEQLLDLVAMDIKLRVA